MPAKSKAQFRFMEAIAHGGIKKPGLSREQAAEYVSGQSPRGLPERSGLDPAKARRKRMMRRMK